MFSEFNNSQMKTAIVLLHCCAEILQCAVKPGLLKCIEQLKHIAMGWFKTLVLYVML